MNTTKTLPREPWRGSMVCGYQVAYGDWGHPMAFCAERKADGLPACQEHWDELCEEEGEPPRFAPGNALGGSHWALRLLWEGDESSVPVEASAEELARYAGALGMAGGA